MSVSYFVFNSEKNFAITDKSHFGSQEDTTFGALPHLKVEFTPLAKNVVVIYYYKNRPSAP